MYVSYHQDDWNTRLPLTEFSCNNSDPSSTKKSLFFTFYGRNPQFDSAQITQDTPAGKLSTKIQSLKQYFKRELEVAMNRFKRYEDKIRASPPVFNPGAMVWLFSKNIKSTRPTKKLSEGWLCPFPILKKNQELPPPIIIKEEEEWEVSQILDSMFKRRKLWYLVEWKGFSQDPERSTWEPDENLKNCPEHVKYFYALYPDKPSPNSSRASLLWFSVGRGITKSNSHSWYAPLGVFYSFLLPNPAFTGLIGQFSTLPSPRTISLFVGLGGLFSLTGAYGPYSHHQGTCTNPSYYWGFGLKGLFGPFRPPTASTACCPWDHLAPFGPNSMMPKGAKGAAHQPPDHKWAHLGQFWPQNPTNSENGQNTSIPKIVQEPQVATIHPRATGSHQRPPPQLQARISTSSGEDVSFLNAPPLKDPGGVHKWYYISLCTIFAQQSNDDTFRTKLPDPISEDHLRTPTTWPCRIWVVNSHQDYSRGSSQRLSIISIIFNTSSTQHSLDNSIGPYR
ncbi:hypothetical protein O181_032420 [Austropuccinia psidii MF-1]|uniref:Chromo domain-containing protein n=1 Tax=Austropuccinia psidii MF-1 TaxID=1389203 RepID=A0A9Q3CZL5_9BASI|nr:hypothetical protein [Austropuccinia psidii MF-1]